MTAPLRIIWLTDGRAYVATEPVQRAVSTRPGSGEAYEHEVAACSSKVVRPATKDEVTEWRIRE